MRYENFRRRIWDPVIEKQFRGDRKVTPHSLRHTWASLHMARGTPIEWVRKMGRWSSPKMLLDVYGHFLPRDMQGFSDALAPNDRTGQRRMPRPSAFDARNAPSRNGEHWHPRHDSNVRHPE